MPGSPGSARRPERGASGAGSGPGSGSGRDLSSQRRAMLWDTGIGFVGFFAMLATIQAVLNVFDPNPRIWPGLLALALIAATVAVVRAKRRDLARA